MTHPDRIAETLAQRDLLLRDFSPSTEVTQLPGAGSADARVDLKLHWHAVQQALRERGTAAARDHLAGLEAPDLLAGTVQDGTARGLLARLEEAISLCDPAPAQPSFDETNATRFEPRILRRKRDILVASAGARLRFSRKGGMLFVDRKRGVHREDCIRFEDRRDVGCLDGFVPVEGERPRLFSPGFLQPSDLVQGELRDLLVLRGRLGRRPDGYPCELRIEGRKAEDFLRLTVRIHNDRNDHRLRIRFLGVDDPSEVQHAGTPGFERVHYRGRSFVAATLVRAIGRLAVGENHVATPMAQCFGWIEHHFRLGGARCEPQDSQ